MNQDGEVPKKSLSLEASLKKDNHNSGEEHKGNSSHGRGSAHRLNQPLQLAADGSDSDDQCLTISMNDGNRFNSQHFSSHNSRQEVREELKKSSASSNDLQT